MYDEGLPVQNHGYRVGSDLDGIGVYGLTVESDLVTFALALQFHHARLRSHCTLEMDFQLHGVRSNCWRRPCDFQREGSAGDEEICVLLVALLVLVVCHSAAAITEASSVPGRGGVAG